MQNEFSKRPGRGLRRGLFGGLIATALAQEMTDVGTPRAETPIVDKLNARVGNPTNMNPYLQGVTIYHGYHQIADSFLWDIDTAKGTQIPVLAAAMPEVLDDNFTRFRVPLRDNIARSDGEPFTADDVIFTYHMLRESEGIAYSPAYTAVIASMSRVDDQTIEIETTHPTVVLRGGNLHLQIRRARRERIPVSLGKARRLGRDHRRAQ